MELKDWLNSINFNKENLIKEDPDIVKQYPPFIVSNLEPILSLMVIWNNLTKNNR